MIYTLLRLAAVFAFVGLGAFGGGVGAIPMIRHELVEVTGWLSVDDFERVLALAQSTPGPIAINAATFVGLERAGILGAAVATVCVVCVPLMLLEAVRRVMRTAQPRKVEAVKTLLAPAVCALFTAALWELMKTPVQGVAYMAIFVASLGLTAVPVLRKKPPLLVVTAGAAGIAVWVMGIG